MKKKVEKSEIEQNICVLLIRMEKRVTEPQFLSQMILGHQITTTKDTPCAVMVLRVRGDIGHLKVNTVTQNERQSRFRESNNNIY